MCKAASSPSPPTTEVADQIKNSTSVDNSWSFINIHLPSAVTTTVIIIIILIAAWILLRLYSRFSKATTSRPNQTRTDFNHLAYVDTSLAICPSSPLAFYNNGSSPDIDFIDP